MDTVLVEKENIDEIVQLLNANEVVAFPTETVFGLGVKYGCLEALEKIYALKHRSHSKAVTLMVKSIDDIKNYAYVNDKINQVIKTFMPGMITLILKKKDVVDDSYTSGLETIGIRIPDDQFVLSLLDQVGPMLVTSANISGDPPLLTDQDVLQQFDGQIHMIVKGKCISHIPSTVVKLDKEVCVLREGSILKQEIEEVYK